MGLLKTVSAYDGATLPGQDVPKVRNVHLIILRSDSETCTGRLRPNWPEEEGVKEKTGPPMRLSMDT